MNTDKEPLPDDTRLTDYRQPKPLTPEEMERHRAIVEKLLGQVFGDTKQPDDLVD